MKEDLMFNSLGNGITVCDRNREEHGDYMNVAHIAYNREITYYDKELSREAIASIEYFGNYENSSASMTQPYPVLKPVEFSKMDVIELKKLFGTKLKSEFGECQAEVATYPDQAKTVVFTTKEACGFLRQYYGYMKTEITEGARHWAFRMYDAGNNNY